MQHNAPSTKSSFNATQKTFKNNLNYALRSVCTEDRGEVA